MPIADEPDPLLGTTLEGRYHLISLIGRGGMGSVYVAEETRLKRRFALKVLHPALARDPDHVERFLREAQALARFDHPNIIQVHAYGEDPAGVVFFIMDLLSGEDLDARIRARADRPFTVHDCCMWGIQIARAFIAVHEGGLIHRDLKAANVFLARRRGGEEVVKLLDFGIARSAESSEITKTGMALGTPSYMAPEQLRGGAVDHRSDIYSFGVLLFKMVTGRLPFTGEPLQVAMQHNETPPPRPSERAPDAGISPAVDAVVLTAMAKRPDERFQSMQEVEEALLSILQAEDPSRIGAPALAQPYADANTPGRPTAVTGSTKPSPIQDKTAQATVVAPPRRSSGRVYLLTGVLVILIGLVITRLVSDDGTKSDSVAALDPAKPPEPSTRPEVPPTTQPDTPPTTQPDTPPDTTPPVDPTLLAPQDAPPAVPSTPVKPGDAKGKPRVAGPEAQIRRAAKRCRQQHGAVDGAAMTVRYDVGDSGKALTASADGSPLGRCFEDAVRAASFPKRAALKQTIGL